MKRFFIFLCSLSTVWVLSAQSAMPRIIPADERIPDYIELLFGKRVGILTNHTGVIDTTHIVDTLVHSGVNVTVIFAPEHGFRGTQSAGEKIPSSRDAYTGIEIVSLYGRSRIPRRNDVFKTDVILVDIQDVGVRFYTYLSSLYCMMQACADTSTPMIILDRPNPNSMTVDGPVLNPTYRSFVGMVPVPVVYGMTLGEVARMINGEGWLEEGRRCRLMVVPCLDYRRSMRYTLPIAPSPNLPTMRSIYLYPSLCYFEATPMSVGRGTDWPFEVVGHPKLEGEFRFTPQECTGARKPPCEGELCRGLDLRTYPPVDSIISRGIDLSYLVDCFEQMEGDDRFFSPYLDSLFGTGYVRDMILMGFTAAEIKQQWQPEVEAFKLKRQKYLIYDE